MSVEMPDNTEDWPFEAKHTALSEANKAKEIRSEIAGIVGAELIRDPDDCSAPGDFTKREMAAMLLALGGPQEES